MRCSKHDWKYLGRTGPKHSQYRFRCSLCRKTATTVDDPNTPNRKIIKED